MHQKLARRRQRPLKAQKRPGQNPWDKRPKEDEHSQRPGFQTALTRESPVDVRSSTSSSSIYAAGVIKFLNYVTPEVGGRQSEIAQLRKTANDLSDSTRSLKANHEQTSILYETRRPARAMLGDGIKKRVDIEFIRRVDSESEKKVQTKSK